MGFRRKVTQGDLMTKMGRRIASLQTHDLPAQVEQCLFQMGDQMVRWNRDGDAVHIDEALGAAEVAVEILREFKRRVG